MGNIEDKKPIDILATRIWGGMAYYYPYLERMVKELREHRKALALVRAECQKWRHCSVRQASGHNDGVQAVKDAMKATDEANALEAP